MSAPWSNATAGVWAGKLGGLGSDPREGSEWCHCSSCARPTTMTGTKLCDRCWETRRILNLPGNELYNAAPELADALTGMLGETTDFYCEQCMRHAPKDDKGRVIGSVRHRPECWAERARAALRKAGRLR